MNDTDKDFIDINGFVMNPTTNGCVEIILPENEYYTLNLPESGINQLFYVLAGLNREPASGTRRFTGAPVGTT